MALASEDADDSDRFALELYEAVFETEQDLKQLGRVIRRLKRRRWPDNLQAELLDTARLEEAHSALCCDVEHMVTRYEGPGSATYCGDFRRGVAAGTGRRVLRNVLAADPQFPLRPSPFAYFGIAVGMDAVPVAKVIRGATCSASQVFRLQNVRRWKELIREEVQRRCRRTG